MTRASSWLCWAGALLLLASEAVGQTTQPAPLQWAQTVSSIADALTCDSGGRAGIQSVESLLPDEVTIQRFGSGERYSAERLREQTCGMMVIADRVYAWPADQIASDIADDLRNQESLPQSLKREFVPSDDAQAKRANATAQRWISSQLQPGSGQVVAVVVLWEPRSLSATSLSLGITPMPARQPVFVLLKGQKTAADSYAVVQISYGDMENALN